jgi:hypothetical protein
MHWYWSETGVHLALPRRSGCTTVQVRRLTMFRAVWVKEVEMRLCDGEDECLQGADEGEPTRL